MAEGLGATVIPVSGGNSERQIMLLKDFGATVICCTPSYFLHLIEAAAAMGVPLRRMKLLAFALGAGLGGVAGALFSALQGFVSPEAFSLQESVLIVAMVVLGGQGSISGAILAAILLTILPEALREVADYRMIAYALILIIVMLVRPQGLLGIKEIWELRKK